MPNLSGMARFLRGTLLITLGVAASVLPAGIAAAANTGGATPGGDVVAVSSSATGGAAPSTSPTSSSASAPKGAAAPGQRPAQTSTSKRAGGAVPGKRPRRKVLKRQPKPPVKVKKKAKKKRVVTPPVAVPAPAPTTPEPVEPAPASPNVAGVFPLLGTYSFGGDDARFGAGRTGHIHQGQDVIADSGTPIVAPVSGSVLWKANQEGGAGIYLVVHGSDGRDYVFMHIKSGTVQVEVGDTVTAGQQLAQVGATGAASGPHLHFEIWVGGWYVKGGVPIDPLPQLQSWAGL